MGPGPERRSRRPRSWRHGDDTGDLVHRAADGDGEARDELAVHYHPLLERAVRRHAYRSLLDQIAGLEDIVSETWKRLFQRRSLEKFEYRGPRSFDRYLSRALGRTIADAFEAEAKKRAAGLGAPYSLGGPATTGRTSLQVAGAGTRPSEALLYRELLAFLKRRLSPAEWAVVDVRRQGLGTTDAEL